MMVRLVVEGVMPGYGYYTRRAYVTVDERLLSSGNIAHQFWQLTGWFCWITTPCYLRREVYYGRGHESDTALDEDLARGRCRYLEPPEAHRPPDDLPPEPPAPDAGPERRVRAGP